MKDKWPYFLANQPQAPNADLEVTGEYTGEVATRVALADAATIDRAIAAAVNAAEPMRNMEIRNLVIRTPSDVPVLTIAMEVAGIPPVTNPGDRGLKWRYNAHSHPI